LKKGHFWYDSEYMGELLKVETNEKKNKRGCQKKGADGDEHP